jgi:hypothetical protein
VSSKRIAGFSLSWVSKVTIAAVVGILFLKWLVGRVPVPGLQRAIQAV